MQLNQIYTISYSQPEEYRFSLDSIFFAQKINDWLSEKKIQPDQIADLCAGCGVVGLELLFHLNQRQARSPSQVQFIEIQDEYKKHFEKNKSTMQKSLNLTTQMDLITENYENLIGNPHHEKQFDLIVCNPPYFHLGQGKLSPSKFKNRCRYFMDSDFLNLIKWISFALAENGSAFLLMRSGNGVDPAWSLTDLCQQLSLQKEILGEVRGTQIVRLFNPFRFS